MAEVAARNFADLEKSQIAQRQFGGSSADALEKQQGGYQEPSIVPTYTSVKVHVVRWKLLEGSGSNANSWARNRL